MKQLLLLLVLFLVGCTPRAPVVVPTDPVEKEEDAVYSALINSEFAQSSFDTLIIDDQTTRGCGPVVDLAVDTLKDEFDGLRQTASSWKNLEQSTSESYIDRNKVRHQLSESFSLIARYTLVSSGSSVSSDTAATRVFLSAVGFNDASDQALVCAGTLTSSKNSGGFTTGYYFLLQKENDVWVIKDKQQKWIS